MCAQIGSYFGSVLTTVDIDKDSHTDVLLVGAPMFMGAEKEEQGKVYVYALNQVTGTGVWGDRDNLFLSFHFKQIMWLYFCTHVGKRSKNSVRAHYPLFCK